MFIPLCDNPVLLTDKSIFYDGSARLYYKNTNLGQPSYKTIRSIATPSTDFIEHFRVVYPNGFSKPPFFFAPCRKCPTCRRSRQNDLILRAVLETESYDCPPYFFTLTYKPDSLPPCSDLCYDDVQKFFKRLRKRFSSKGLSTDFRYLVSGEYGQDPRFSHRPHYHVILWNNPYKCSEFTPYLERLLFDDILSSWNKCLPNALDFGQVRGGAAAYATKYVQKPMYIPKDRHVKPFVHCSSGKGGLGSRFYTPLLDYYKNNPTNSTLAYTSSDGTFKSSLMSSTIFKHMHPSLSSLVPFSAKKSYKSLIDNVLELHLLGALTSDYSRYLLEKFHPYPLYYSPQYQFNDITFNTKHAPCSTLHQLVILKCRTRVYKSLMSLRKYIGVDLDPLVVESFEKNRTFIQNLPTKDIDKLLVPTRFKTMDKISMMESKLKL